jgi:cell wall-associated NlpC family hydrolase
MAPWVAGYIGLPYRFGGSTREGLDCWGLVRLVLAEQFGKALPEFPHEDADQHGLAGVVVTSLPLAPVDRIAQPEPGDLVLLRLLGVPCHIGIAVGEGYMLHTLYRHDSALERLAGSRWAPRIEGYYRVR